MTTLFFPFFVFAAVMLLCYGVWFYIFDRPNQTKKKHRLQTIHNAVHWRGQSLSSAQTLLQENAFESWLRSRFRTYERLEGLVKQAKSPLTAMRLLGVMSALFTIVLVLGLLRHANPLIVIVMAAAIGSLPLLWLSRKAAERCQAFGDKLPDALDYVSRALRAGHSLSTSIGMLGKEFPDPIGEEFKTVSDEMLFGIAFKDAIGQLTERVPSADLNFFVISLMIHHETGGNLTELLDGLANTMRERVKLRGKVRTLSSEGRASGWILGSMPFLLAGILMFINPKYISLLWTTPQGLNLIYTGAGLMTIGFFMLSRIIKIKV